MSSSKPSNPWLALWKPNPQARMRLFCLPYAGGGASLYRGWSKVLPPEIEICPIQLPGREGRLREKSFTQADTLCDAAVGAIRGMLDLPFAFFGYSMGSVLAYELATRIARLDHKQPELMMAAARRAPSVREDSNAYYLLPDDELKERLRELDGTPESVLEHPELMELMLPIIRADFELNDTYLASEAPPLRCPVIAYGGIGDTEVSEDDLEAWRKISTGSFKRRMFRGGHFFIHSGDELLETVIRDLHATLSRL